MDFRDTPQEAAFRADLRSWLTANLPEDWSSRPPRPGRMDMDFAREWSRKLHDAGYTGLTWPTEFGGHGLSPMYQGKRGTLSGC